MHTLLGSELDRSDLRARVAVVRVARPADRDDRRRDRERLRRASRRQRGRRADPRARRGGARPPAALDAGRRHRPGDPPPRRLPSRPDALGRRRLGDPRLRGRAGAVAARAPPEAQPAARRRRACSARSRTRPPRRSCCAGSSRRPAGRTRARTEFLAGYRSTIDPTLVPSGAALDKLLAVFELEKAVYELRYELNHRPDWLRHPGRRDRADARRGAGRVTQARASAFGELDIWLARAGRHEELWAKLGAHPVDGGVRFAVWAPNAQQVSVIGDFNDWDPAADVLAAGRRDRHLGRDRRRRRGRATTTSTTSTAARRPTRSRSRRRCRRRPRRSSTSRRTRGSDEDWIDERRVARAARAADLDLRGARAVVARTGSAGASSPTSSRRTCRISASRTSS